MERLTTEYIESQIAQETYLRPFACTEAPTDAKSTRSAYPRDVLTICVLTMKNGLHVVGESACLNPAHFDAELGKALARQNAFSKLWQLEGYARASAAPAVTITPKVYVTTEQILEALRNDPGFERDIADIVTRNGMRVQVHA
jgi:hypothetical protein